MFSLIMVTSRVKWKSSMIIEPYGDLFGNSTLIGAFKKVESSIY